MLDYWGWMPHLHCSFDFKHPETVIRSLLGKYRCLTICVDDGHYCKNCNGARIVIDACNFQYDIKNSFSIAYNHCSNDIAFTTMVTLYRDGFIVFSVDQKQLPDMDENQIKSIIEPIYFELRMIFGCHIANPNANGGNGITKSDYLSIYLSQTKNEVTREILHSIYRQCDNNLFIIVDEYNNLDESQCIYTITNNNTVSAECLAYGRNLVNIMRNELGDEYEKIRDSFENHRSVSERICSDQLLIRQQMYEDRKERFEKETKASDETLNRIVIVIGISSMIVSFLAGSIMCDIWNGRYPGTNGMLAYVFLAGLVVVWAVSFGYLVRRYRPQEHPKATDA